MGLNVHLQNGYYQFNGPFTNIAGLARASGVYVVTTVINGVHKIIDVGESQDILHRLTNHDRAHTWPSHASDMLYFSAMYCTEGERMMAESQIRGFHSPPCGER